MSRFDILCVVRDEAEPLADEQLAKFVVTSHMKNHPAASSYPPPLFEADLKTDTIPQDLLRKYIVYSKLNVHPKLSNMDQDKVAKMYSHLRQESLVSIRFYFKSLLRTFFLVRFSFKSIRSQLNMQVLRKAKLCGTSWL